MAEAFAPRPAIRGGGKSAAAFRTISEVAFELDLPQHVLRFWETRFTQLRPLKRGGGRRYYRPEDVSLLRRIQALLYEDGYTIRGVQKLLREDPPGGPPAADGGGGTAENATAERRLDRRSREELKALLAELEELRRLLRAARR